ncbi:protein trichome birefringence-like 2 [Papaver somniferum]|uniref:protein trichome birefringence-like 2 n=1 Tax=Papaver somniferum TaxID=3469 RepID=UPI000E6FA8C4|nr:protein trichome birefringence-like 2 [Papaver somniferum]
MELKKLPFLEPFFNGFSSSKRKIFSSFSLGVGSSLLILSLIYLYAPVDISLFQPLFQGFGSSSSSAPITTSTNSGSNGWPLGDILKGSNVSSDLNLRVSTHQGNSSESSKNTTFLSSNGGEQNMHKVNLPEVSNKSSFSSSNGRGEQKINAGNFTELRENGTLISKGGSVDDKTPIGSLNVTSGKESHQQQLPIDGKNTTTEVKKSDQSGDKESVINKEKAKEVTENNKVTSSNNESGISSPDKVVSTNSGNLRVLPDLNEKCDVYKGRWVRDENKPYYPPGSCPHIDKDFDCHLNGRPDGDYLRWRWQPDDCNMPSLNAIDFLERLRGKRIIFVGDSLNRNMWESLVCMLRHGVGNKSRVHERSGQTHFKGGQSLYDFRYEGYNCSVQFVSAPFLVRESFAKHANGTTETLRLDLMDKTSSAFRDADVVVFNTGHWWTHEKTSKGENYYQEGTHLYPNLDVMDAFKKALTTWGRWVDKNINANRTQVIFRGYSVTHFKGGQWNSGGKCHNESEPIFNETFLAKYPPKMKIVEDVLKQMKTPVIYMNISRLTDFRKDGHPSIFRMEYKTEEERIAAVHSQDCSHWCLPGVPDTWNELLYASLLKLGKGTWRN